MVFILMQFAAYSYTLYGTKIPLLCACSSCEPCALHPTLYILHAKSLNQDAQSRPRETPNFSNSPTRPGPSSTRYATPLGCTYATRPTSSRTVSQSTHTRRCCAPILHGSMLFWIECSGWFRGIRTTRASSSGRWGTNRAMALIMTQWLTGRAELTLAAQW